MADLDHEKFADEINKAVDRGASAYKPRLDANTRVNPATVNPGAPTLTDDFNRLIERHEQTIVFLKAIRDTL